MNDKAQLPHDLGDNLTLRWATPADTANLADFNIHIHSDNPDQLETWLGKWTEDLMSGDHPTTTADDFLIVVDKAADDHAEGKIVSTLNIISQTWLYDGVPIPCGRVELVGTDRTYRRRGLVRAQMNAIHTKSAAKGELMQSITGIPWYYRQFGYEMTLTLGGYRRWLLPAQLGEAPDSALQLRPFTPEDIPWAAELYTAVNTNGTITRQRSEAEWHYESFTAQRESPYARHNYAIMDAASTPIGYIDYRHWGPHIGVRELVLKPNQSWLTVGNYLCHYLHQKAIKLNQEAAQNKTHVNFYLGPNHPLYTALDAKLLPLKPPYAWYIRVPDLTAFLHQITPILEKRLAASPVAGYSGSLRLNRIHEHLSLRFEKGKLVEITPYQPKGFEDGDAIFPEHTFLHLLFGHITLTELQQVRADCFSNNDKATLLLNSLFPKQFSNVIPLG